MTQETKQKLAEIEQQILREFVAKKDTSLDELMRLKYHWLEIWHSEKLSEVQERDGA